MGVRAQVACIISLVLSTSCSKARPQDDQAPTCVSYKDEVARLLTSCASCHSGATPAAGYDTTSYLGLLAPGSDDTANVVAGEARSRLLERLGAPGSDAAHSVPAATLAALGDWVVGCRASYLESSIHPPGLLDRTSSEFHAKTLRALRYDFAVCARCHGADFRGGTSGVACTSCHQQGPNDCSTCHGDLLLARSPAHRKHLAGGALGSPLDCGECHRKPGGMGDEGHMFLADGTLDPPPVEVMFGAWAARDLDPAGRAGPPSFSAGGVPANSCQNMYCHGATLGDPAATHTTPVWSPLGVDQAACGSCHGTPPASHGSNRAECVTCHAPVVDAARHITTPALHLDGKVTLVGDGGCTACHGTAAGGPAPPRDLGGMTSPSGLGVGAHASHVNATHGLGAPIACTECHLMPTRASSPGHLDSDTPAEVFPVGAGMVARARGATPVWDRGSATCAGNYCHGSATPVWTHTGQSEAGCGSCHAVPPATAIHTGYTTLATCSFCHPNTVDTAGNILVTGPAGARVSKHINGVVDVP